MPNVEEFLEHHGVKGMKWGVRKKYLNFRANDAQRVANRAKAASELQPNVFTARGARKTQDTADRLQRRVDGKETKQDRNVRYAKNAVAGALIAGLLITAVGAEKTSSLPKKPSNSVVDVLKRTQSEQMSSLTRTFKEGHMNEAQYKQFAKSLNDRYARKIAEAAKGGL